MQTSNIALKPMTSVFNMYKQPMQWFLQIPLIEIIENLNIYEDQP